MVIQTRYILEDKVKEGRRWYKEREKSGFHVHLQICTEKDRVIKPQKQSIVRSQSQVLKLKLCGNYIPSGREHLHRSWSISSVNQLGQE